MTTKTTPLFRLDAPPRKTLREAQADRSRAQHLVDHCDGIVVRTHRAHASAVAEAARARDALEETERVLAVSEIDALEA